jgi:hypothetical protein
MRLLLFCVLAFFTSYRSVYALPHSDDYFKIAKIIVKQVDVVEPLNVLSSPMLQDCKLQDLYAWNDEGIGPTPSEIGDSASENLDLDYIVNIGKKVWEIVNAGTPVVNVKRNVAHALPSGVFCWLDLESWKIPKTRMVHLVYENIYGMKVVEFVYRLSFIYGGQMNGKGYYITEATVHPAKLFVAWGFKFNATVDIPAVYNMGTKENPVAGMQVNINWAIDTPINHNESTDSFSLSGAGEIIEL